MTVAAPALSTPDAPRRAFSFDSTWLIWIAIIAVLLFLVVSPFLQLLITSFKSDKTGALTLANYATAYGRDRYVQALINSLELGACAALLAGVFAVPLAWAVSAAIGIDLTRNWAVFGSSGALIFQLATGLTLAYLLRRIAPAVAPAPAVAST